MYLYTYIYIYNHTMCIYILNMIICICINTYNILLSLRTSAVEFPHSAARARYQCLERRGGHGGCHPGNTPFNTIKKGSKKSNKGWIASRTRNTSMTWRKSFISSERTWKSCVLNVENVVWICMEAHKPSTCESVDDYVCNHLQNWDVDGFPGCGSFCRKKQGSRTNASKFTSRTNKKLQIFRVTFSRLGFYSPLYTWLNLGKLGWLQKTPKTITWWPWRNTIAAPRGSVARSKMVLAAVTWRSPMIFIDSYLSWTSQRCD